MITKERVQDATAALHEQAVATRRHLHQHPELSFEESETADYVAAQLQAAGIPHRTGVGGNGIVGVITGSGTRTVALRADMDALPIQEQNEVSYCSRVDGVMHACGHDAHTTSLLTAGRILADLGDDLPGRVVLIFQHAEERAPGGAAPMIEAGILEGGLPIPAGTSVGAGAGGTSPGAGAPGSPASDSRASGSPAPRVDTVVGQHVNPEIPAGTVGFHAGLFMASVDDVYITIKGKGGHAAKPQQCVDPVTIASTLVVTLQQIVSRRADPIVASVLSFGRFIGAGAHNVIPDEVSLAGTFRTTDPAWRDEAVAHIEKTARELVESLGASAEVNIVRGYPSLYNDEELTARARARAEEYLGADNVVELPPAMWAEDFAYFGHHRPACFYNLGVRNEAAGIIHPVHSSRFNLDEEALKPGAGLLAWIALGELEGRG
jgi:metal-dependent amidase/aminoacylase/carboxypeptidase family protein